MLSSLIKPFGVPFKVTPKGSGNEESEFDAYTFLWIASLIAITSLGLIVNIVPEWSRIGEGEFSVVSAYWAVINIVVLMIAALICFEKPRPLVESFSTNERARVLGVSETYREARIVSLSLDGGIAEFATPPGLRTGDYMWVEMDAFPHLRCTVEKVAAPKAGKPVSVPVTKVFGCATKWETKNDAVADLRRGRPGARDRVAGEQRPMTAAAIGRLRRIGRSDAVGGVAVRADDVQ